eukprot:6189297-Pleurochrysis_carterae.AAC.1
MSSYTTYFFSEVDDRCFQNQDEARAVVANMYGKARLPNDVRLILACSLPDISVFSCSSI